jgi:hypothetical protein
MKKVLAIFLTIFFLKSILSLFIGGMVIYPDESCFFLKAQNFAETFKITPCHELVEVQIGNPYPLYSILISIVFFFFENASAQKAIFIINAFLSSIIIFPIYKILFSQIKNKNKSLFYAGLLTLLPIITSYERLMMSETLFICLGIFSFYYYQKSLNTKKTKTRNKIISFFLSILATFTRPFGFILPLSLLINEIFLSKKKHLLIILTISISFIIALLTEKFIPNARVEITEKILSLKNPGNFLIILKSLKNQINSLSIETLLIPSLFFFTYLFKKSRKLLIAQSDLFDKTKIFLISFISLNFIISAQHIYKYLLAGIELDLSSRYLNLSILFIFIFFFIIIQKIKELKLSPIIFGIFTLPLFFLNFQFINHALNISLSPYYKNLDGFILENHYFTYIFLPTTLILLALSLFNKKHALKIGIISILLIQSTLISIWHIKYSIKELNSPEIQFFQNKKSDILFMKSYENYLTSLVRPIYFDYFRVKTLSSNNSTLILLNDIKGPHNEDDPKWHEIKKHFDYIITPIPLSLTEAGKTSSKDTIYKNQK